MTIPRDLAGLPVEQAEAIVRARLARSPRQVAEQLARFYGHKLDAVVYIPAVAMVARVRLGQMEDVRRIVEPYAAGKPTLAGKVSASHLSGHLIFAEVAERTGDSRYVRLVEAAADLASDAWPLYSEMSDGFFMGCPILAAAGKLTGRSKYFEACLKHMRRMMPLTLRADGLHRHSPLCEAAWGRGNGFAALGLAWSLRYFPSDEMRAALDAHLKALAPHRDGEGMWHQVIDIPPSYAELSATAMIAMALGRGAAADRAWEAVKARTSEDGTMVDVCASTGKMPSVVDYLMRPASLGRDDRGGAMVMLLATYRNSR